MHQRWATKGRGFAIEGTICSWNSNRDSGIVVQGKCPVRLRRSRFRRLGFTLLGLSFFRTFCTAKSKQEARLWRRNGSP